MSKYLFFCICVLLIGCASQKDQKEEIFTVSESQTNLFEDVPRHNLPEVKYGYSVYLKLIADADIVTTEEVNAPIQIIGQRLAQHATRRGFPYIFTVINDNRIWASSTPGGYVYIATGMIEFLDNENEVAAVLAHELAQTQRRRMGFTRKKHIANFIQGISAYTPWILGPWAIPIPKGVKLVNNLLLREASRKSRVIEADDICVLYLANENYPTQALLSVVKKVVTADAEIYERIKDYQRLRPITEERIIKLKEHIGALESHE